MVEVGKQQGETRQVQLILVGAAAACMQRLVLSGQAGLTEQLQVCQASVMLLLHMCLSPTGDRQH